ncbi:hypothetical protein, partial [Stutzerimonas chloritidismutans]
MKQASFSNARLSVLLVISGYTAAAVRVKRSEKSRAARARQKINEESLQCCFLVLPERQGVAEDQAGFVDVAAEVAA